MMNLGEKKYFILTDLLDELVDKHYVLRFYDDDDCESIFYRIVGYTLMGQSDAILHLIDDIGDYAESIDLADQAGIHFEQLSTLVQKYGFDIFSEDQDERLFTGDEDEEEEDWELDFDWDELTDDDDEEYEEEEEDNLTPWLEWRKEHYTKSFDHVVKR